MSSRFEVTEVPSGEQTSSESGQQDDSTSKCGNIKAVELFLAGRLTS